MKYEIDSIDGLDENVQKLYEKSGDKYRLKIEGLEIPDVDGLKSKVQELLDEKKAAQKVAREAEKAAAKAVEEAARKSGDVEALENSWKQKLADREAESQAKIDEQNQWIRAQTVEATALKLATTLAVPGSADVLMPHIERRLGMDVRDGKPVAVVLDAQGKPSALSVDDLAKEFTANQAFAPLIAASNASGGGAAGANGRGGAAQAKADMAGSKEERVAAIKRLMAQSA
jgi:hypothetical protein